MSHYPEGGRPSAYRLFWKCPTKECPDPPKFVRALGPTREDPVVSTVRVELGLDGLACTSKVSLERTCHFRVRPRRAAVGRTIPQAVENQDGRVKTRHLVGKLTWVTGGVEHQRGHVAASQRVIERGTAAA